MSIPSSSRRRSWRRRPRTTRSSSIRSLHPPVRSKPMSRFLWTASTERMAEEKHEKNAPKALKA
ncbi:RHTO0S12e03290g1_1 [Rhodotorula toruloides]|uniref:RHTO0S12e03290g1_1 n=1 Tax=Rhodotorula toruloides TaxID=5286 RepID=A0A061BEL4_RHOTO|nr:RHTO0S12e03290g1_1 [Rhodotorula toruloides]